MPVGERPTKKMNNYNIANIFSTTLRDAGQVALIDGDTSHEGGSGFWQTQVVDPVVRYLLPRLMRSGVSPDIVSGLPLTLMAAAMLTGVFGWIAPSFGFYLLAGFPLAHCPRRDGDEMNRAAVIHVDLAIGVLEIDRRPRLVAKRTVGHQHQIGRIDRRHTDKEIGRAHV